MDTEPVLGVSRHRLRRVFAMALVLAACIFLLHTGILFEMAHHLSMADAWLTDNYSAETSGRVVVLVCFFILFLTHVIEATLWGLFLWRKRLVRTFTEGVYFAATSITALGYGDVVLVAPWRMLGPLMAINGLLMFGCSTAFLFLVLEKIWAQF